MLLTHFARLLRCFLLPQYATSCARNRWYWPLDFWATGRWYLGARSGMCGFFWGNPLVAWIIPWESHLKGITSLDFLNFPTKPPFDPPEMEQWIKRNWWMIEQWSCRTKSLAIFPMEFRCTVYRTAEVWWMQKTHLHPLKPYFEGAKTGLPRTTHFKDRCFSG